MLKQLYYFAIVRSQSHRVTYRMSPTAHFKQITNFLVRFSWIMYLPSKGLPFNVRSFVLAMLEMLRRWQWNFCKPHHP